MHAIAQQVPLVRVPYADVTVQTPTGYVAPRWAHLATEVVDPVPVAAVTGKPWTGIKITFKRMKFVRFASRQQYKPRTTYP